MDVIKSIPSEYYGDSTRWFIATVVNSTPPAGYEGRVKIRIHGLHSESTIDIPEEHLPWAQCLLPTTEGGVSGIGKIPRVLPSALVFGMFMDGNHSQTPIVLGSLPKIERPSQIQIQNRQRYTTAKDSIIASAINIADTFTETPDEALLKNRAEYSLQFFLNIGYSYSQSIGITDNLFQNGMYSGFEGSEEQGTVNFGVGRWVGERFKDIKSFSPAGYTTFSTQLEFIAFELNGKQRSANIRLLQSEKIKGKKGSLYIFSKYYLKRTEEELKNLDLVGRYQNG